MWIEGHYEESEAHPSSVPIELMVSPAEKKEVLAGKLGHMGSSKRKRMKETRDSDGEVDRLGAPSVSTTSSLHRPRLHRSGLPSNHGSSAYNPPSGRNQRT